MTDTGASSWQITLADLALILFLLTAATLHQQKEAGADGQAGSQQHTQPPSALFDLRNLDADFDHWLAVTPKDPRQKMTIMLRHQGADPTEALTQAQELAQKVHNAGFSTRIMVEQAAEEEALLTIAYDNHTYKAPE